MRKLITLSTVAMLSLSPALIITSAEAGGLFGRSGSKALFRGSVGTFMEKPQKKVFTPLVRTAVVIAATAGAVYVGGPLAGPIGTALGHSINEAARGGGSKPTVITVSQPAGPVGGTCSTDMAGEFPLGQTAPLDTECAVTLSNGKQLPGRVTP